MDQFFYDLQVGKSGEAAFAEWIAANPKTKEVLNVADNSDYYHRGDFKVITVDGRTVFFDVKTDRTIGATDNVALEILSNNIYQSKGWLYKSCADWIAVYDTRQRRFIMYKLAAVRQYYEANKRRFAVKDIRDDNHYSQIALIPLSCLLDEGLAQVYQL